MPPKPAHKFTVTLEDDSYTDEKFAVYQHYQRTVHKEEQESLTKRSFARFLCNSPLRRGKFEAEDGTERDIGSFHQCYRIDGKLVAVGILDLLPHCVSSVYFMYDESLFKFSPGKLSAMMEISLALERGYKWWYAGFYIHSSPKMKYKMDFSPQYILDASEYEYMQVDSVILSLLDRPYCDLKASYKQWNDNAKAGIDNNTFVFHDKASTKGSGDACEGNDKDDEYMTADDDDDDDQDSRSQNGRNIFLLNTKMPGIPTLDTIRKLNLDNIPLRIRSTGYTLITGDISYWKSEEVDDFPGLKASIVELVAALGDMSIVSQVCLEFMR
ncbi:Arginyl-tRNA--protein transferase 1 [Ceratocystis platani]|uniref:Arginyl-tRNA--protein transferase 1 n=1 Tax=Ceratocystis fimbriata f. sp. platani TaxID=88771 RepID=A0A0F8B1Q2_CERFI|nr:Arginyl-tRNA--protein transferase 1 [Ceratocystis platani]